MAKCSGHLIITLYLVLQAFLLELTDALVAEQEISTVGFQNLVDSFPKRLEAVIAAMGGPIWNGMFNKYKLL